MLPGPIPPRLLLLLLGGLLALGVLLLLWVALVRWYYRLRLPRPERLEVVCADGWALALYRRRAPVRRWAEPVVLCHGLAANHYTFDFDPPYSLAHALAAAGFDCYSVELRGTGRSARPPRGRLGGDYCVDEHIRLDAPTVLAEVLRLAGAERAFWVGHSMGGLVGYGLAQGPQAHRLAGLVVMGSPVFFSYRPWMRLAVTLGLVASWPFRLRHTLVSIALAPFLGYVTLPFSDTIVNPRQIPPRVQRQVYAHLMSPMGHKVLRQFLDWIRHDVFRSFDHGTDWRAGLKGLRVPLLVMGGTADVLAAPAAVEAQYALAGSTDKTLVLLGCAHGSRMDYGHGDLLYGEGVPTEVHPRLVQWLQARAHLLPAATEQPPLAPVAGAHVREQAPPAGSPPMR